MHIYMPWIKYIITTVWGPPLTQQPLQRLERMQNRAIRLSKYLSKFDHVSLVEVVSMRKLIQLRTFHLLDVLLIPPH